MANVGIVLSGGGAKGAFEIGVLEVLLEKIKKDGDILVGISGTSIGAFNGAFVASGQFELLKKIWLEWTEKTCPLISTPWYGPIINLLTKGYMYDPEPLNNFFDENLDSLALKNSDITFINTMVNLSDGKLVYGGNRVPGNFLFKKREIMASMAFIPGTPSVEIDGVFYGDGGFRDTIPVSGLLENSGINKYDKIYIISVEPEEKIWYPELSENNRMSVIKKFLFVLWDILWDENSRSDIEIGKLKYWNKNPETFKVIRPKKINLSTTDFNHDLIVEAYNHGLEIAKESL